MLGTSERMFTAPEMLQALAHGRSMMTTEACKDEIEQALQEMKALRDLRDLQPGGAIFQQATSESVARNAREDAARLQEALLVLIQNVSTILGEDWGGASDLALKARLNNAIARALRTAI